MARWFSVCYSQAVSLGCFPPSTRGTEWLSSLMICFQKAAPTLSQLSPSFLECFWPFSPTLPQLKYSVPGCRNWHICSLNFPAHCRDSWSFWPKPWKRIFGQTVTYFKPFKTSYISCSSQLSQSKWEAAQGSFPAAVLGETTGRGHQDAAHCFTGCTERATLVLFQALSRERSSAVVFFYLLFFYFVDILMEI